MSPFYVQNVCMYSQLMPTESAGKNKSQLDLTGVSYVHTCLYLSNIIQREDVPSPLIKSSYICSAASKNNTQANMYLKIVPFEHKYYDITS